MKHINLKWNEFFYVKLNNSSELVPELIDNSPFDTWEESAPRSWGTMWPIYNQLESYHCYSHRNAVELAQQLDSELEFD